MNTEAYKHDMVYPQVPVQPRKPRPQPPKSTADCEASAAEFRSYESAPGDAMNESTTHHTPPSRAERASAARLRIASAARFRIAELKLSYIEELERNNTAGFTFPQSLKLLEIKIRDNIKANPQSAQEARQAYAAVMSDLRHEIAAKHCEAAFK